jgi:hypothetical protein
MFDPHRALAVAVLLAFEGVARRAGARGLEAPHCEATPSSDGDGLRVRLELGGRSASVVIYPDAVDGTAARVLALRGARRRVESLAFAVVPGL